MAIKKYIYKMYEKILKKLQALNEIYDFDIYEFMDENTPSQFSYLISCHKDNCFEVRKMIARTMADGEGKTVFIVRDSQKSTELSKIKKKKLNKEKL